VLLPVGRDAFDVESWPFTLSFETDGEQITGFKTTGPALPWTRFAAAYDRAL
jgi:hypothetical protein